ELTTAEKHRRVCYVVPEEGADLQAIERTIKTMPNYFAEYHTEVNFITEEDRKSTRLNSSHVKISYAVFCLKKKKKTQNTRKHQSRAGHHQRAVGTIIQHRARQSRGELPQSR